MGPAQSSTSTAGMIATMKNYYKLQGNLCFQLAIKGYYGYSYPYELYYEKVYNVNSGECAD